MATSSLEQPTPTAFQSLTAKLSTIWTNVRELPHGIRVAVVPSLSVVLGLVLFWGVTQAQDLFLEVIGSRVGAVFHWAVFYAAVLLAWALPVYFSARWIIARYNAWARTTMGRKPS